MPPSCQGLNRQSTHGSGLSQFVEAIRDEYRQDQEERRSDLFFADGAFQEFDISSITHVSSEELRSIESSKESTHEESEELLEYPVDGKFALWQAFLAMLLLFLTWGANASFGVFLNFYMSHSTFPGATNYDFAIIGGIVVLLAQGLAPISWFLITMFGHTAVLLTGVFLQLAGYILASFSTQLWQLYCCQGVLVGASFSFLFISGTLVLPSWFDKRKATGMGICVSGAGLGGLIFSLVLNKVIAQTDDYRWPLRMMGFISLAVSLFAVCFLRPRNKKTFCFNTDRISMQRIREISKVAFNFELLKSVHFVIIGVWYGLNFQVYVICMYSFSAYATSIGLSRSQANNLLAVLNAGQAIGRPLLGHIGDLAGRTNTAAFFSVYLAILILAFWRHAASYGSLLALSAILGIGIGISSVISQSLGADLLDIQERPHLMPASWTNLNIIVCTFSFTGEIITIALKDSDASNPYNHAQIYSGSALFLALLLLLLNREYLVRRKMVRRREHAGNVMDESDNKELSVSRIRRYDWLLQKSITVYFIRMFYPMRV